LRTRARLVTLDAMSEIPAIRTPDQRLRVFVSSTLEELADERAAVRRAIERLRLSPVMFELGARPHPPRQLYRAYLAQSHLFIGIYWQRYGWIAPGETMSGLEDEHRLAAGLPQLVYIKEPAPDREAALTKLLDDIRDSDTTSYRRFRTTAELEELVAVDLAVVLSERFEAVGRSAADRRTHAPVPAVLTPTVGRDTTVAEVVDLFDAGTRLVTLTGPGGVGKTRVALEVAHAVARRGGDVHHVPLAAVTAPDLVMTTTADRLGVGDLAGRDPVDALADHLGSSDAWLVLDNLEQVIAVAPKIGDLLARTSGLRILATSRQALRIRGEHELAIDPLPTPGRGADADAVAGAPAVQLFVDRARAAGGRFALTPDNAAAVAELCRRLGGLPLALELVAARVRIMSPQALLDRLGSALDLPGGGPDLPDRQRTLRATLDWSHALLDVPEQTLFARMGVFAGGATLDAVESVAAGDDDLVETLAGLLDKSLVLADDATTPGGEPRFRMLEPVRAYARAHLDQRADAGTTRRRHFAYFCRLGHEAQPFLCGPRQREWAARFDAERADLRVAVATGERLGALGDVLRLTWDTLVYYYIRDAIEEPRGWLRSVASHRATLDGTQQALLDVGRVIVGDPPDGDVLDILEDAVGVFDDHGLELEAAVAYHRMGLELWARGDVRSAIARLETSSGRYEDIDHDWGVATVEITLGAVYAATDDLDAAIAHLSRSLVHSRRIDNRPQMAQGLQGIALAHARMGRTDQADAALREAISYVVADRSLTGASYCLEALAALAEARGDIEDAARLFGTARATRQRLQVPEWTAAADAAEPVHAAIRRVMPPEQFARAWDEGSDRDPFARLRGELDHATSETGTVRSLDDGELQQR
jgi:predicted ATPase